MGIEALYKKRNTSSRHASHSACFYLLHDLAIDRSNMTLGGITPKQKLALAA
jgi:hypothetical protein